MTASARSFFDIAPYALAFLFAALIPRRQGLAERIGLGIVAALSVLFVKGLWPGVGPTPEPGAE